MSKINFVNSHFMSNNRMHPLLSDEHAWAFASTPPSIKKTNPFPIDSVHDCLSCKGHGELMLSTGMDKLTQEYQPCQGAERIIDHSWSH